MADRRKGRKGRLLALAFLAVGGAAAAGYVVSHPADDGIATVADPWTPTGTAAVSPPPADPEDVATDTPHAIAAHVQITYALADDTAGGVTVGAVVAGIIEDGGQCTLTLEQGDRSASTSRAGLADATTTTCGQLLVPFTDLEPGTWTATVAYASTTGQSVATADTTVEVPR